MAQDNTTLDVWRNIIGNICDGHFMAYHLAKDHEDRIVALEKLVDISYDSLTDDRQLNYAHSEDALTVQIVRQLRMVGVEATHNTQRGGHCDVLVQGKDRFLWIAEAKIDRGFSWLKKGFLQLSTRYGVSGHGRDHGEIIIYCRQENALAVLKKWRAEMAKAFPKIHFDQDELSPHLFFRSRHDCKASGLPFYVRHSIVPLYWPKEKLNSTKL